MFKNALVAALVLAGGMAGGLLARPRLSSAEPISSGDRSVLVPLTPARLLETRPGSHTIDGQFQGIGKLGAGDTLKLTVAGRGGVPADATAVVLNVTALEPTTATFLTLWPSTAPLPLASNLNPTPGQPPTPNLVTVGLGDKDVSIFNLAGDVDVVADVMGYYADHNHDDRYYTKELSDAKYGPKPGALGLIGWASITLNGDVTFQYTSNGTVITREPATFPAGSAVTFPGFGRPDRASDVQVTAGGASDIVCGVRSRSLNGGDLIVNVTCHDPALPPGNNQVLSDFEILVMA
jgi:hypothetical protein